MLGDIVQCFDWQLVRIVRYGCSPFTIHILKQNRSCILTQLCSFQTVQSEPRRAGRKAAPLKVAMVFPTRKTAPKRAATEPLAGREEEEGENFLDKRAINIKENKEMVRERLTVDRLSVVMLRHD